MGNERIEMNKSIIETKKGPQPKGQYSQIVVGGPFVFLSGQLPFAPDGKLVDGDIQVQTKQILKNIKNMLEEAGSSLAKAVRMGVYIIDIDDFQAMNEVYIEFFPEQPPARTTLVVSTFPPSVNLTACGFFLTGLT